MLSEFILKKLREARYKFLKDGSYFGEIASLRGVWANAKKFGRLQKGTARSLGRLVVA